MLVTLVKVTKWVIETVLEVIIVPQNMSSNAT